MIGHISIVPSIGDDRSITKDEWKSLSSYCRLLARNVKPIFIDDSDKSFPYFYKLDRCDR